MRGSDKNTWSSRRAWLVQAAAWLGTISSALFSTSRALAKAPRSVHVQALGKALPEVDVAFVEQALTAFYGFTVSRLSRVELPRNAYYAPRARYRAEKLLDFLGPRLPAGGFRILGLTAVDISTTKPPYEDWGILGLATLDGSACVLSLFRAGRGAPNRLVARQRLGKVAVHEIGHTLGLPHCENVGCLMEDAQGKVATTDREYDLCADCRQKLKVLGFDLPKDPSIPWPKP